MKHVDVENVACEILEKCGHSYGDDSYRPRKKMLTDYIETDEQKVVNIVKGEFEKRFGMSYDKFVKIYNEILKDNPEKLI